MANEFTETMAAPRANDKTKELGENEEYNEPIRNTKVEFFETETIQEPMMNIPETEAVGNGDDYYEKNIGGQNEKQIDAPLVVLKSITRCIIIAFGGFIVGWDVGIIGGITNMESFQENFGPLINSNDGLHYFPEILIGLIISIFSIGGAIGGLTIAKAGDWKGRKFGLHLSLCLYCLGLMIQLMHDYSWYQFFIGRIVTGLAVGPIAVLVPMFLSETAPIAIKGAMTSLYQLMATFGIMMGNILNYILKQRLANRLDNISWQLPIFLGYVWATIIVIGLFFTPESANFLLIKKRSVEEARHSFAVMNGILDDDNEVSRFVEQTLQQQSEAEIQSNGPGLFQFITSNPKYCKQLIVGVLVMIFQQLSGINYFLYYGTTLFKKANLNDPYLTSICLSSVNFISTFGGIYLVEALGRKSCLLLGSIGMFFCMLVYSTVGTFALNSNGSGIVMIAFTCIYIIFFATTLGPVTFVVVSELFPMRTKAISMAICSSFNWMFGFAISLLTPVITAKIGFIYGYFFTTCLFLSTVFVWFMVPETKDKSDKNADCIYST